MQEVNTSDVEVEIDEVVEVGIGDEDMVQHDMKHASVSESPTPSPKKYASQITGHIPLCSPSR